jgi:ATP-dependent 26S proteasome regulatory subunit
MDFLNALTRPALCLWDEVEAIFINRKRAGGECDREVAAALTIFMQALDRWKAPILLVMATNLPEQLDEALMSRVEMRVEFLGPNEEQCGQCIQYWSELLHDHGSAEWGPLILERCQETLPASFRELQQMIAFAAREWTARKCGK